MKTKNAKELMISLKIIKNRIYLKIKAVTYLASKKKMYLTTEKVTRETTDLTKDTVTKERAIEDALRG